MEREIKFRGHKCQGGGEWIYGNCLMQNNAGTRYISNDIAPSKTNDGNYSEVVHVGQFTGLLDCNAKRIYEGDIIEVTSLSDTSLGTRTNAIVIFRNSAFQLKHKAKEALLLTHWAEDVVKVIGNIYDNKELLKGE